MSVQSSAEIRAAFLRFFESKGHKIVPSASLVPGNDPTLLFTNAGMVPFKDVFLGSEQRDYRRATSSQRCVRAGGKHNDLENVGYTARHHTFFEMLGNFSFGDYFKRDAIHYAWELVTQVFELPPEKLWVTVYAEDDEAYRIWHEEIGMPAERMVRIGDNKGARFASDNFWQMGDTGPCGPCSEIFYDHGEGIAGGPPGSPDEDGDRYIEIWNLVFMQYERSADGSMKPLPKPSVDTGMGLERIAAVLQGVHSNYDIDLFVRLIDAAAAVTACEDRNHNSLKVIADHIRSTAFLMLDGVLPSNEGRGYVLRRIMRRAIRHGYKLGQNEAFFYKLLAPLVVEMGQAYPDLIEAQGRIEEQIRREEERFAQTLSAGMQLLEKYLETLHGTTIEGEMLFKLYDTYGFPVDLTADIARERGLQVDLNAYECCMQQQRERAQSAGQFKAHQLLDTQCASCFDGYDCENEAAVIQDIFLDNEPHHELREGEHGVIVLDCTPFYAESGGQVGDRGTLNSSQGAVFVVENTQRQGDAILHYGLMQRGILRRGDKVEAEIDHERRAAIRRNHSATHLLHAALRQILGKHVQQKGSLVDDEHLRFDFSHPQALSHAELRAVETLVNQEILRNLPVNTEISDMQSAKERGAMALFGEKYGEKVRVLSMNDGFSVELCGGTHVRATGDIGMFCISAESAVSSGIRRIEALTGMNALKRLQEHDDLLHDLAATLKSDLGQIGERVQQQKDQIKQLEKDILKLKRQWAGAASKAEVQEIKGYRLITQRLDDVDGALLRERADQLRQKEGADIVVIGSADGELARLVVSVDKNSDLHAGQIIAELAQLVDGKGGGRPDFAQAGGKNPQQLDAALHAAAEILQKK